MKPEDIRKLKTIIGKIETLQHLGTCEPEAIEKLGNAKTILLQLLRDND